METEVLESEIAAINLCLVKPTNAADYKDMEVLLDGLMDLKKSIAETFDPIIKKAYETHKEACAQKNKFEKPRLQAEEKCRSLMTAYLTKEEEAKARLEAELSARLKEDIKARAESEEDPEEKARLEQEAASSRVTIFDEGPGERTSTAPKWEAEVYSLTDLCAAIVAGRVPEMAVTVNQTFLNQSARTFKDQVKWPGVRFIKTVAPKRKRG